jgi:chromosome segregation ATPase
MMPDAKIGPRSKVDDPTNKWKRLDATIKDVQPHIKEVIEAVKRNEELLLAKSQLEAIKAEHAKQLKALNEKHSKQLEEASSESLKIRRAHEEALLSFAGTSNDLRENINTLEGQLKALKDAQEEKLDRGKQRLLAELESTKDLLLRRSDQLETTQTLLEGTKQRLKSKECEADSLRLGIGWDNRDYEP